MWINFRQFNERSIKALRNVAVYIMLKVFAKFLKNMLSMSIVIVLHWMQDRLHCYWLFVFNLFFLAWRIKRLYVSIVSPYHIGGCLDSFLGAPFVGYTVCVWISIKAGICDRCNPYYFPTASVTNPSVFHVTGDPSLAARSHYY